jgi:hypothetical protein
MVETRTYAELRTNRTYRLNLDLLHGFKLQEYERPPLEEEINDVCRFEPFGGVGSEISPPASTAWTPKWPPSLPIDEVLKLTLPG